MSINVKKYTKDQMAKMVEEATERQEAAEAEAAAHFKAGVKLSEENEKLRGEIGTLTEKLDQMNGEAITRENEIANLKADADVLRNKLADTEAALGRANDDLAFKGTVIDVMRDKRYNAEQRANYAESHPWRNLWAWVKRKVARHE
jgi:chromosome segregation ATPase